MTKEIQTYKEACKQHIIDTLSDYKGQNVYISELGSILTEGENANGSWYCSRYHAEQDLKAWFDDIGDFIEEYELEYGSRPQYDAFVEPERFHCLMMIVGVEKELNKLDCIQELWDERIELTEEIITKITKEIEG